MEQKPVQDQELLAPPSADIAQKYLDEADAVAIRRERSVDRRGLAWLQIVNALVTAVYLTALAVAIRSDVSGTYQVILFGFLMWGQLASGAAQRSGMQWRMTWSRWPVLMAGGALLAATLVIFGLVAFDPDFPVIGMVVPAALVVLGFGGYGVVQLVRASADVRKSLVVRTRLSPGARWGTILVGVAVGLLMMLGSAPDGVLTSILILLVVLMLFAWIVAARTEMGLPAVGASWRWPHLVIFGAASCMLSLVVLADDLPVLGGVVSGVGVIALFVAVSFVPGRDLRD